MRGTVEHLHMARAAGLPMEPLRSVAVRPGVGLAGDRYARGIGHFSSDRRVSRDITLVAQEAIDELRREFGIALEPGETRRNVTTSGIDLNQLVGRRFFIGDVLCAGTRLCNPCQYLADLLAKPLVRPMVGRGGLRADLLTEGEIHVGDSINTAATAELVIGTINPGKAHQVELALKGLDVNVRRLSEVMPVIPMVEERSADPRQNAREKARVYSAYANRPVLAIDFALYLERVADELQPGAMVRRILGYDLKLDDDHLIRYYSALIARYGGRLKGRWHAAFALAVGASVTETDVIVTRTFVADASPHRNPGYPLASLQLTDGLVYVSELGHDEMAYPEVAPPLRRFIAAALSTR